MRTATAVAIEIRTLARRLNPWLRAEWRAGIFPMRIVYGLPPTGLGPKGPPKPVPRVRRAGSRPSSLPHAVRHGQDESFAITFFLGYSKPKAVAGQFIGERPTRRFTERRCMTTEPVKMAEIAARAGVSIPTVSKVLNNRPGVSDATRARVEQIVSDAGYERRSKGALDTGLIDIVLPGLDTQWAADLMRGAHLEAAAAGIDLVVSTTGGG